MKVEVEVEVKVEQQGKSELDNNVPMPSSSAATAGVAATAPPPATPTPSPSPPPAGGTNLEALRKVFTESVKDLRARLAKEEERDDLFKSYILKRMQILKVCKMLKLLYKSNIFKVIFPILICSGYAKIYT